MGLPEILIFIGLIAGFAKFQLDFRDDIDKRMDKIESELLRIVHQINYNRSESLSSLEVIEARINMLISQQESFMDRIVCKYEHIIDNKND